MAHYIYGKNVVKQWILNRRPIRHVYLSQERPDLEILRLAKEANVPLESWSPKAFSKIDGLHQNVVAEIDDFKTYTLEEVLPTLGSQALVILLDGLEDPHNLGAILRTADAVGVDAVVIPKHGAVGLTPTVAKVSTGAIDTVRTVEVVNLSQTIDKLKKAGFWIFASESTPKAIDYRQADYRGKAALIIGSEGKGISPLVLKHADVVVKLPMLGKVTSLNASVSAAILMYEVLNQRFPRP